MVENRYNSQFNPTETNSISGGLIISRNQGEGIIIKGFGQIFLISYGSSFATIAFQSPTDFNKIDFHKFELKKHYKVSESEDFYISIFATRNPAQYGTDPIAMRLKFPKSTYIISQEKTSITQNLLRPLK